VSRSAEVLTEIMRQAWPPQSKNGLWSLFGPSKISRTVLFAKPILLTGGKIAQIGAESQFSQNSNWYTTRKGVRISSPVNPNYQNFFVYCSVSPIAGEAFPLFLPRVNTEMMNLYLIEMQPLSQIRR
jgi:hypothetical protein